MDTNTPRTAAALAARKASGTMAEENRAAAQARWQPQITICTNVEYIALHVDHPDERVRREAAEDVRERIIDIAGEAALVAGLPEIGVSSDFRAWQSGRGEHLGLVRYWPGTARPIAEGIHAAISRELMEAAKRAE